MITAVTRNNVHLFERFCFFFTSPGICSGDKNMEDGIENSSYRQMRALQEAGAQREIIHCTSLSLLYILHTIAWSVNSI